MAITKNGALPAAAGVGDVTLTGAQTLSNKTLTAPKFADSGFIADANGNELIAFPSTVASAVNQVVIENAATGDGATTGQPIIRAQGNDTNISLNLVPKGSGVVQANGVAVVTTSGTQTLINKSLALSTNTVTGTLAELNTAITDADIASLAGSETLTNKTLTTPTLNDPKINLAINAQTGTTYTFVLTDNGKVVTASNASSQTYTIPPVSSVAFPTGANFTVVRKGAGAVAFAQGSGVTIRSTGATATAPTLRAQYSTATCIHEGSDVWYVVGDIA